MKSGVALLAGLVLAIGVALSQPRDGQLSEQALKDAASECRADPVCMKMVRRTQAEEERAQAEFEALPIGEKIMRWILGLGLVGAIVVAYTGLFSLFGRRNEDQGKG